MHRLAVWIAKIALAMRWIAGARRASIDYHLSTINYWLGTTENTEDTEILNKETNDGICRVSNATLAITCVPSDRKTCSAGPARNAGA